MPDTKVDDVNTNTNTNTNTDDTQSTNTGASGSNDDLSMVEKLVAERVAKELKDVKDKLNKAYSARDEAQSKLDKLAQEKHEQEVERLKAAGKDREAFELEKAQLAEENKKLKQRNVELSRDSTVRSALTGLNFRNDKAADVAFKDIVGQLVQDDNGNWMHRSGVTVKEFVEAYSNHDDQSFLFKAKSSNGAGTGNNNASGNGGNRSENKSLFEMSQAEVLALAAKGKFGAI